MPEKKSIKTITVNILMTVVLIAALIMTIILGISFRGLSHKIVRNQALAASELIKAGLTSHMKAGIMDKRDYFLKEIETVHDISSVRIIRSPEVTKQFGPGKDLEHSADSDAGKVFETKKPVFILDEFSLNPHIRAVIPYIAVSTGELICTNCHQVAEGTVLGAVDIMIDLTEYRNIAVAVLSVILIISLILVAMIIANIIKTMQKHVKDPLENLVDETKEAFLQKKLMDAEHFESLEFTKVAKEINLFNAELIKHQRLIEEKNRELITMNDEIEDTLRETIFTMGVIEEQRSKETKYHTKRVSEYCRLIARDMGLSQTEIELVAAAAPLHDIGKIAIPDNILMKKDKLSSEEFEIMKDHTNIGHSMLRHSHRDVLMAASIIALQHHEKWDGSGYPGGLKGESIHIYGRIVALADVFDALSTARYYKEAWSVEQVVQAFRTGNGSHFDPRMVEIMLDNIDGYLEIRNRFSPGQEAHMPEHKE